VKVHAYNFRNSVGGFKKIVVKRPDLAKKNVSETLSPKIIWAWWHMLIILPS
jgi:hypothetical protein